MTSDATIRRVLSHELFPCALVFAWCAVVTACDHTFFRGTHYMLAGAVIGVAASYVVRVLSTRSIESVLVAEVDAWDALECEPGTYAFAVGMLISVAIALRLPSVVGHARARIAAKAARERGEANA